MLSPHLMKLKYSFFFLICTCVLSFRIVADNVEDVATEPSQTEELFKIASEIKNDPKTAIDSFSKALESALQEGSKTYIAKSLHNIGRIISTWET